MSQVFLQQQQQQRSPQEAFYLENVAQGFQQHAGRLKRQEGQAPGGSKVNVRLQMN